MNKRPGLQPLLVLWTLVGACADAPAYQTQAMDLDYAAGYGQETGESGDAEGEVGDGDSLGTSGVEAGDGDGDGDGGGDGETGGWLDPQGTGSGGGLPDAGLCFLDGSFIAGCNNEDPLTLDCTPAFIALCESSGYSFESIDPQAASWGWDCDNYNDFIADCTSDWFTSCAELGGFLDCHNEEDGNCVEASCETEPPTPG
jgi:hypothetical protein